MGTTGVHFGAYCAPMTVAPPTAADRQRRYRQRRKFGLMVAAAEVPADVVAGLAERGWLDVAEAEDPRRLGDVLVDVDDCLVRGTLDDGLRGTLTSVSENARVRPPAISR